MALPINQPSMVSDPSADLAMLQAAIKPEQDEVVKKLAIHIDRVWEENQKTNKQPRLDMIATLRRVKGDYDPVKLAAIRAFKGSEAYIRSGENKARAADSWLKDIYRGDSDLPWALEPTAIPDVPGETLELLKEQTLLQVEAIKTQLVESGAVADDDTVAALMQEYYDSQLDKAKEEIVNTAKERCRRASDTIRDQNQEGGWNNAFKDFLYYFIRLKAGIIKGPTLTKKPKQVWKAIEGDFILDTVDTLVNDVYCVSPFNFFPSQGMKDINNGDVIELHELTKKSVSDLIGVPGYSEMELRAVLDEYKTGELKSKWFTVDDETAVKQATTEKTTTATTPTTQSSTDLGGATLWAQEFWGTVSGSLLIEWGAEGDLDPNMQYSANCWKIGKHVIKAVINPDNLNRKPYHVTSWAKNPEWIWGEGLLEFAAPIEDAINAITRALINNIAIASGPLCEIDKDRVDTKLPIYPWRQIESTSMQMKNDGPAVNYYQPQMHAQELIAAWTFFSKVLDEMTVPAYAQGASQSGVTAGTATVFTQLLAAASRSIKAVAANIDDDVITPYTQMCYDALMKTTDDVTLKGDARIVAKGVAGLLAKEQQAQKKVEYLQTVANPAYTQILGAKNIGSILAQIAKSSGMDLPDMARLDGSDDIDIKLEEMMMAASGVQQNDPSQQTGQLGKGGGKPKKSQGQNPDGSKAGVVNG
jgi:hypothetical protein